MSLRKNVLKQYQIITNGDASQNLISEVTSIQFLDNISITLLFPGATGTGQFFVEVSNDGTNWVALDIYPAMYILDADKAIIIDMNQLGSSNIRVRFTSNGSSGVINAFIEAKAI